MRFIVYHIQCFIFFSTWLTCDFCDLCFSPGFRTRCTLEECQPWRRYTTWKWTASPTTTGAGAERTTILESGENHFTEMFWGVKMSKSGKRCVRSLSFCNKLTIVDLGTNTAAVWRQMYSSFPETLLLLTLERFRHFLCNISLLYHHLLRPPQSLSGWDVHHSSVTEVWPLQDDQTQAGQRQWCEPKEVQ